MRKISRRRSRSSRLHTTWPFHVLLLLKTAKKCAKIYNARAQPLFCSLNLLFGDVLVAGVVVVCSSSLMSICLHLHMAFFCRVNNRSFPHSNKQWRQVEVGVDKNTGVWKCSPRPRSGAIVRTHWSGMRERSFKLGIYSDASIFTTHSMTTFVRLWNTQRDMVSNLRWRHGACAHQITNLSLLFTLPNKGHTYKNGHICKNGSY